jgi:LAGLIDADG-like domain
MQFRKYKVNTTFFDTWTPEMAYILGFISADGSVNNYTLSIELHSKDIEILNFIKQHLCLETPITYRKHYARVRFNSTTLVNRLNELNVIPAKSKIIRMPLVPTAYLNDYIRGVFDGDGSVTTRRNSIEAKICSGSEKFLEDISLYSKLKGKIRSCVKTTKKGLLSTTYSWVTQGKFNTLALRDFMYQNPNSFALKRKKDIFFSDFYKRSTRYWTDEQIAYLVTNFKPKTTGLLNEISHAIGKSRKAVSKKIWELSLTSI